MKAVRTFFAAALVVSVSSCLDQGPRAHDLLYLSQINVPSVVAANDSLRVSFRYMHGVCDTDIRPEVKSAHGARMFYVTHRNSGGPCILLGVIGQFYYAIPPSQRTTTFTLTFVQPDGQDSVVTVVWQ
jgi:hypothetical protein